MEANLKFLKGYFNVCQNIGISISKTGYDPFNSDSFVSILMWMLILKCWMRHKVIVEAML